MRYLPQVLKRVTLLLKRVIVLARTFQPQFNHIDLKGLFGIRREFQFADHGQSCTGQVFRVGHELRQLGIVDQLDVAKIRPVIEFNEPDGVVGTIRTDPTLELNVFNPIDLDGIGFSNQFITFTGS